MGSVGTNSDVPGRSPKTSSTEPWTYHEHVADPVATEAQRLVNLAGSVELAKQSLNATAEPMSASEQAELAIRLGYDSYERLMAASTVVVGTDNSVWCITMDRNGRWVVWEGSAISVPQLFNSMEEALANILDDGNGSNGPE